MKARLLQTRCWVFDLDNTLYPPECDLFAQIDVLMTRFVADYLGLPKDQARIVQKQYYAKYGTTLNGLMQEHGMPPGDYLAFVHDIDVSVLRPDPDLRAAISALPGRKMVFTNGSTAHAARVLAARGLDDVFETIIDIEATRFVPKPSRAAYQHLIDTHNVNPHQSVMVEDLARNLKPAYDLGFMTVLVHSDKDWSHEPEGARPAGAGDTHEHVHFSTGDLSHFLHDHVIAPLQGPPDHA